MIGGKLKKIYTVLVADDELNEAEEKANAMLDVFFEHYDELHHLIHHRKKAEQTKLKKEFPDIYYKDVEAQKQLIKLARFVNRKAKKNGSNS